MIKTEMRFDVPADKAERLHLRRMAGEFISLKNIEPPVSIEELSRYASELISMYNLNEDFRAFIMVCCGNAIWQPVVSSVPYNRRILLLPQCMKNSRLCKGEEDELGLLCSACGNCNVSGLVDTAEDLGYMTIVSEGTTLASRLVEEGRADAVIGVSCMEVLQKMYASVAKHAVPSIGIPLLNAGCKDTRADLDWVNEEIRRISVNPGISLFNLKSLRKKAEAIFCENQLNSLLGPPQSITEKMVHSYLLTGGKRIRPMMTLLAIEALNPNLLQDDVARLALSIECFHKASLIHDDIEDNDASRYGTETLHKRYGIPVAINAGDLLIGEGYRLIAESGLGAEIISKCVRTAAEGHRLLSIGQGQELMASRNREILSLDETITLFDYKASTAFRVALLLGALAGEANEETIAMLERYSHHVGIAYQIMDDTEDFTDPTGKIDLNKPSIFLSLIAERISESEQVQFLGAFYSSDNDKVKHLAEKYRVKEKSEELLKFHLSQTKASLENLTNPVLKIALHEILGKIFNDYL